MRCSCWNCQLGTGSLKWTGRNHHKPGQDHHRSTGYPVCVCLSSVFGWFVVHCQSATARCDAEHQLFTSSPFTFELPSFVSAFQGPYRSYL